jgi:hypothetical protein
MAGVSTQNGNTNVHVQTPGGEHYEIIANRDSVRIAKSPGKFSDYVPKASTFLLAGGGVTVLTLLGFAADKMKEHGPAILEKTTRLFNTVVNVVTHPVTTTCMGAIFAGLVIGALAGGAEHFIEKHVAPMICNAMTKTLGFFGLKVPEMPEFIKSTFRWLLKIGGFVLALAGGAAAGAAIGACAGGVGALPGAIIGGLAGGAGYIGTQLCLNKK